MDAPLVVAAVSAPSAAAISPSVLVIATHGVDSRVETR